MAKGGHHRAVIVGTEGNKKIHLKSDTKAVLQAALKT
jgi:hypothetical protein